MLKKHFGILPKWGTYTVMVWAGLATETNDRCFPHPLLKRKEGWENHCKTRRWKVILTKGEQVGNHKAVGYNYWRYPNNCSNAFPFTHMLLKGGEETSCKGHTLWVWVTARDQHFWQQEDRRAMRGAAGLWWNAQRRLLPMARNCQALLRSCSQAFP